MGVVVAFDFDAWKARYPEVAGVGGPAAAAYFAEATLYHANDGSGPVSDAGQQQLLLGMVTAHVAEMYRVEDGELKNPLVGRISDASQGSVSVTAEYAATMVASAAFWAQTRYGASYWQATAQYRTMRYRSRKRRSAWPFSVFVR